ncbi:MAG: DUF4349 domain-containing protein [Candidatus Hydrogenedentales bacterium]|jgi:hypothetical protein
MKRFLVVSLALAVLVVLATQCGQSPSQGLYAESSPPMLEYEAQTGARATAKSAGEAAWARREVDAKMMVAADYGGKGEPQAAPASAQAPGPAPISAMPTGGLDRYLIKNATVLIEVGDAREANAKLLSAVQAVGGYVGDYREQVDGLGRRSVIVQIRVPANQFDASMGQLDPLGKVLSKQVSTQDVTEEFVDTDARARNLKATEARLVDHLNRAGKLEDILRIEQEVTRVRQEIEQLDGRLRFLNDRVQFSTIMVTLQEAPKAEPVVPTQTFSTGRVVTEAVRSLIVLGQAIWVRVIWWGVWSVVWVPCLAVAWLLYRRLRKAFAPIS